MNIVIDKKIIAFKTERVKGIATNLRNLIKKAVMQEWINLHREKTKNKSQTESIRIENIRNDLYKALESSICECPGCNQSDRDMVYNASLKGWYCTLCTQEYRDFYYKQKPFLNKGVSVGDFDEYFHSTFL